MGPKGILAPLQSYWGGGGGGGAGEGGGAGPPSSYAYVTFP